MESSLSSSSSHHVDVCSGKGGSGDGRDVGAKPTARVDPSPPALQPNLPYSPALRPHSSARGTAQRRTLYPRRRKAMADPSPSVLSPIADISSSLKAPRL